MSQSRPAAEVVLPPVGVEPFMQMILRVLIHRAGGRVEITNEDRTPVGPISFEFVDDDRLVVSILPQDIDAAQVAVALTRATHRPGIDN